MLRVKTVQIIKTTSLRFYLPTNYQSFLPYVIPGGCSEKTGARMESFLKPKLVNFVGAGKNYQKRLDSLSQCLAIKAHLKPQISALVK